MKRIRIFLTLGLAAGLVACTNEDENVNEFTINGKHPIELTSNINSIESHSLTRAEQGFDANTRIAIKFEGEKRGLNRYKHTTATAIPSLSDPSNSPLSFQENEYRYWEDFYGRETSMGVYCLAVPNKTDSVLGANTLAWDHDPDRKSWFYINWKVSTTQTANTYANEDLIMSKNIRWSAAGNFTLKYRNGAFEKGHLLFTHALSKITVNLIKGKGFTDEEFAAPTVILNNFCNSARIDMRNERFDKPGVITDITPVQEAEPNSGANFTYSALVIPNHRNWDTIPSIDVLTIKVGTNTYYVKTSDFNSYSSNENKLTGRLKCNEQYCFNVVVNKTDIELTASLLDWDAKSTQLTPVIIKTSENNGQTGIGTKEITQFDLYRSAALDTGYDEDTETEGCQPATLCKYEEFKWTYAPAIYWPDHITPYYYRALGQLDENGGTMSERLAVTKAEKDYVEVNTSFEGNKVGTDICLGAPYRDKYTLMEPKKAENGDVNLTFKHKMAEIFVQLLTTTGTDAIDLTNATVKILKSYTNGKLLLGEAKFETLSGARTASYSMGTVYNYLRRLPGDVTDQYDPYTNVFRCYAIPQELNTRDNEIEFEITAAGNTYYAKAATLTTTSWVEGTQYLYKLTLSKSKIDLSASLVDWDTNATIELGVKL